MGYHTYVVGSDLLVVHNTCSPKEKGVYELNFDDGSKYIGKGSRERMQQSIRKWTKKGKKLVSKKFTACESDKSAFILEHIKMMESDFGKEGCKLLNKIFSPGRKYVMLLL